MKTALLFALAIIVSQQTFATPITLTGTSNVKIQGTAAIYPSYGGDTDSYLDTRTATGNLSTYNVDLENKATATGIAPSGGFYLFGMDNTVTSHATQATSTTANSISVASHVNYNLWPNSQIGSLSAYATSDYNATFRLASVTAYNLTLNSFSYLSTAPYSTYIAPSFRFFSADGSLDLGISDATRSGGSSSSMASWSLSQSGLLSPGDYHLSYSLTTAWSSADPIGVSSTSSISINLGLIAVPETGSVIGLLMCSIPALGALLRTLPNVRRAPVLTNNTTDA